MRERIITNLKTALKAIRKSGNEGHPKHQNVWQKELIWIEDAITFLEDSN